MDSKHIIISENPRPLWQIAIASLFFTAAFAILILFFYQKWSNVDGKSIKRLVDALCYLIVFGITFSFKKSVYIDIKKSKFRSTFEIGPIKLGQWQTINNYEYVSIFHQPLKDGNKIFELNLWYNDNQHWELYEKNDFREAFLIGYEISEILQIDILDATVPNDYKWIDKKHFKETGVVKYY